MSSIEEVKAQLELALKDNKALHEMCEKYIDKIHEFRKAEEENEQKYKELGDTVLLINNESSARIQDLLDTDARKQTIIDALVQGQNKLRLEKEELDKRIESYKLGNDTLAADNHAMDKELVKIKKDNAQLNKDNAQLNDSMKTMMKHYETILRDFFKGVNKLKPLLSKMTDEQIEALEYLLPKLKF